MNNDDKAVLHHLDQRPVRCHPFKPIHLGGSFRKDPKRNTGRLLFLPPSERDSPAHPDFSPAFPTGGFRFSERASSPEGSYFTFMAEWKTKDVGFPTFL
ncbi:hypothetical protein AVEN_88385-1 [Araneus ventricosus]|uniref:Uncharacterized protein n=1 Tax=Araneus ventricosus TaxID=182803 RepID=A0A4Y2GGK1_ARAVE|nr:hypothetical protein AVEN_88385-1 [Araneus ventricosus]